MVWVNMWIIHKISKVNGPVSHSVKPGYLCKENKRLAFPKQKVSSLFPSYPWKLWKDHFLITSLILLSFLEINTEQK